MRNRQVSKPNTQGGQIWLVNYECRTEAVRISALNDGFFAPGQEPLWDFGAIQGWFRCVHDPGSPENDDGTADKGRAAAGARGRKACSWWMRR